MDTGRSEAHPDLDLVRAALADDEDAAGELARRMTCVPRILAALNARRGRPLDEHDLADTAQDTLVVVWRKLGRFEGRSSLEGWAYAFCHLQLMNAIRRKTRAPQLLKSGRPEAPAPTAVPPPAWDAEQIHKGIDWLGEPSATIVRLKHFEDLTFAEIAARLAMSTNSVKTRYYRGLEALHEYLRARGHPRERSRS